MAFTIAVIVGAGATAYGAYESHESAKKQAAQIAENARQAALQANENARGNALAAQSAQERDVAIATQKQREKDAALTAVTPDVQPTAAADPAETARRRLVRATFTQDDTAAVGDTGSIRV